jgi:hypothetical protein
VNGKWNETKTPHERLAVVIKDFLRKLEDDPKRNGHGILPATNVGATDLAEYLEPYAERERLLARIEEARILLGVEAQRISELVNQLYKLENERIPQEYRLYL